MQPMPNPTPPFAWRTGLFAVLIMFSAKSVAAPKVVASILPVFALAASVMAGTGSPELILEPSRSPHITQLRPSEVRKVQDAALVLWVGPGLEPAMARLVTGLGSEVTVLQLMKLPGIKLLPARHSGAWSGEHYAEEAHHDDPHRHDHDIDPHLWLDIDNAKETAGQIRDALSRLDPAHSAIYERNTQKLHASLDRLDKELANRLAAVKGRPYLVFHDAYQYFESRYRLAAAGAVQLGPDRLAGAGRIKALLAQAKAQQIQCLFREPQFTPKLAQIIEKEGELRTGVLDPLGSALAVNADAYRQLLLNLADGLTNCLSP